MSLLDFFRRKTKTIDISNSKNVNVIQAENYTQKEEATIDWVGLTVFPDDDNNEFYTMEESGSEVVVKPLFTLQSKADWPGKYKQEFPLILDFTFNNSGDKPAVIHSVELEVLDARIDNQAAFEARPEVNDAGYLMLQIRNFGWSNNKVLNFEPFSDQAKKFWDIDSGTFKSINVIEGHLTIVLGPELADKLIQISDPEIEQLKNYRELLHAWTPNTLFGQNFEQSDELTQFLAMRNELIEENKILNSEIFFGSILYQENEDQKEYKLNWGFENHSATSFDLIRTAAGFELLTYQHPLAFLPPGMEYQAKISVNDEGKTITVKTSQNIEGGKSDRFQVCIHPEECLFATIRLKVNFNGIRQIIYPKNISLNLLEYKHNGDYQKVQRNIDTTEYEYSVSEGRLIKK